MRSRLASTALRMGRFHIESPRCDALKYFLMATSCQPRSESNGAAVAGIRLPSVIFSRVHWLVFCLVSCSERTLLGAGCVVSAVCVRQGWGCGALRGALGSRSCPGEPWGAVPALGSRARPARTVPGKRRSAPRDAAAPEAAALPPAALSDARAGSAGSPGALEIPCHQHLLVRKSPGTR